MWNKELVNKAIFFATEKHNGQIMKHPTNMPYSAHFTGVTLNAIKYAINSNRGDWDWDLLVCSAILHDTLEDTNATYEEIEEEFGKSIADGVLALTKNNILPKDEKMKDSVKRIKEQPEEIALVKLADRLFNLRDRVPEWSEEKVEGYMKESEMIVDYLGFICPELACDILNEIADIRAGKKDNVDL